MKDLTQYIQEALKVTSKSKVNQYSYQPKDDDELVELLEKLVKERGPEADFNDIDTSLITDMSFLFHYFPLKKYEYVKKFNGDISKWDVSNVKNMQEMFDHSPFNGDISKWDVSNVENMHGMFDSSHFNGDISKWDVSNVKTMKYMFKDSVFDGDIENWNVGKKTNTLWMFKNCPLAKNPPKWWHGK